MHAQDIYREGGTQLLEVMGGPRTTTRNQGSFGERFFAQKEGHAAHYNAVRRQKRGQIVRIRQILADFPRKV